MKNTFLGQGRVLPERVMANGGPEDVIDHLQDLELLQDCPPTGWHFSGPMEQVCKRAQDAWKRHNHGDWVFQFRPHWQQDIVKLPDNENMHASFYVARPSVFHGISPNSSLQISRAVKRYFPKYIPAYMLGKHTIRPELEQLAEMRHVFFELRQRDGAPCRRRCVRAECMASRRACPMAHHGRGRAGIHQP